MVSVNSSENYQSIHLIRKLNHFQALFPFQKIMSLLTRNAMRLLRQNNWSQIRQMSGAHSEDGWKVWKKLFYFVACPVIIVGHVNAFVLPDASEHDPPPFVPYDHLRIRSANT